MLVCDSESGDKRIYCNVAQMFIVLFCSLSFYSQAHIFSSFALEMRCFKAHFLEFILVITNIEFILCREHKDE